MTKANNAAAGTDPGAGTSAGKDIRAQKGTVSTYPYRLLAPGPVSVPPSVLRAMNAKILHHRTPQFSRILDGVWFGLREVFATSQPVLILTGTGTSAMEAAVTNTLSPGDESFVVVSGKFGERWADICQRMGVKVKRWNVPWGHKLDVTEFSEQLKQHPNVKTVFSQVCETSTATLHPVREMAKSVRKLLPNALFAVDAITGVGCLPLPMDEWDLDVVVGGSQKAFMLPTGLSFIALSERAWKAQAQASLPRYYFDLAGERKANAKGDSQFSIPTPLVVGLATVLEKMLKGGSHDGLTQPIQRCQVLAETTRQLFPDALGLKVFSQVPSPSVTALVVPEGGQDSGELRDWLEQERNITIMGGQDQLKGKVLRIGHMGDVRDGDMVALFQSLGEALGRSAAVELALPEFKRRLEGARALFDGE